MIDRLKIGLKNKARGLVHCITNPISINQCANALLAVGAKPIMAEHPREVSEITASASALLLNIGNITDVRMKSMKRAAATANRKGVPIVLDAVGAACSGIRRKYVRRLAHGYDFALIKGNYSEICALYDLRYGSVGVDADAALAFDTALTAAKKAARKYGCVILASGKTDIVTDGRQTALVKNGTPQLSRVTGTGCMLGALCAAFCANCDAIDAAVLACAVMGISAERIHVGNGSFTAGLIDAIAAFEGEYLADMNLEVYNDEKP